MPYRRPRRKTYSRSRKRYTRRAPQTGLVSYAATATRALALATRLASIVNSEKDNFDVAVNIQPNLIPIVQPLQLIPEGDDIGDREGRSIKLNSLTLHLRFLQNPSNTGQSTVRFALIRDNWAQGAYPAFTDIFVSTLMDTFRQINSVDAGRFTVLMDKTVILTPLTGGRANVSVKKTWNIESHVKFIGTGGTSTAIGKGQMYVICWSDQAANSPSVIYQTRTRYYDN